MSNSESIIAPPPKRGRPRGKNRVPLTQEQRRARNAEYERQRRGAYAVGMDNLAAILECPETMSGEQIVKSASRCIRKLRSKESLDFITNVNNLIQLEIQKLSSQYGISVDEIDDNDILPEAYEVPEDILSKAHELYGNKYTLPEANIRSESEEDDLMELVRTHTNKRGRKRRKLEKAENSQEVPTTRKDIFDTPKNMASSSSFVDAKKYGLELSAQAPSFSKAWSNPRPTTSTSELPYLTLKPEFTYNLMTSDYSRNTEVVRSLTPGYRTAIQNHGSTNESKCQPWVWPQQSVNAVSVDSSPDYFTLELPTPEDTAPTTYPIEETSPENCSVVPFATTSPESFISQTPSPDAVTPEACVIPDSIMPHLISCFENVPTPESTPSISPTNMESNWSTTGVQPEAQFVQPEWYGQEAYSDPYIIGSHYGTSTQTQVSELEDASASRHFTWSELSPENYQAQNNFRENRGIPTWVEQTFPESLV